MQTGIKQWIIIDGNRNIQPYMKGIRKYGSGDREVWLRKKRKKTSQKYVKIFTY